MNLQNKTVKELKDLKSQIELEINSKVGFWDTISEQLKLRKELDLLREKHRNEEDEISEKLEKIKSNQQKEIEKLGYTIVMYRLDESKVGLIDYSKKYDEDGKYYCIDFSKSEQELIKRIDEVTDEDVAKIAEILNLNEDGKDGK
jgi:hypothetical protein